MFVLAAKLIIKAKQEVNKATAKKIITPTLLRSWVKYGNVNLATGTGGLRGHSRSSSIIVKTVTVYFANEWS